MRRPLLVVLSLTIVPLAVLLAQPRSQPKKWAVLIGVNNYEGTTLVPLHHTTDDMKALQGVLRDQEFDVTLLTNSGASRTAILAELQ